MKCIRPFNEEHILHWRQAGSMKWMVSARIVSMRWFINEKCQMAFYYLYELKSWTISIDTEWQILKWNCTNCTSMMTIIIIFIVSVLYLCRLFILFRFSSRYFVDPLFRMHIVDWHLTDGAVYGVATTKIKRRMRLIVVYCTFNSQGWSLVSVSQRDNG